MMRVVEPHEFKNLKKPKQKNTYRRYTGLLILLIAVTGAGLFANQKYANKQPASQVKATQTEHKQVSTQSSTPPPAPTPLRTYKYCVGVRGVAQSEQAPFAEKVDFVLNLNRGWSLNNKIKFEKVTVGCEFTVWLSSPEYMTSFGGLCDSEWSCRAGNAVVANYEKWTNASSAWRKAGGSLDFYQVMLINHEVGHWFGLGHTHCAGPGQFAPVMQQQSIDLEGCYFNPWPNSEEQALLQKQLGL